MSIRSIAVVPLFLLGLALPAQSLLKDVAPGGVDGSADSAPHNFVEFGGYTYFTAVDHNGRELWRTDGSKAGTRLVLDVYPGPDSGFQTITNLMKVGSSLMFAANTKSGYRLFRTDGTAAGTRPVGPVGLFVRTGVGTQIVDATGKILYFAADDGVNGFELWRSDGTDAGTRMVTGINPGKASGLSNSFVIPIHMALAPGGIVFNGNNGASGFEPWYSNGTAAGTVMLHDVNPGAGDSTPRSYRILGTRLLFLASITPNTYQWFSTDGATLTQLSVVSVRWVDDQSVGRVGNVLLFSGFMHWSGSELWRTDGTVKGTHFVKDIYPGNYWSNTVDFVELSGVAYFQARTPNGFRLYRSDGTDTGTTSVVPTTAPTHPAGPAGMVALNGKIYFRAVTGGSGFEPWVSDGTAGGTKMLGDAYPGAGSSYPTAFTSVGTKVVFRADTAANGEEPWITDGTSTGTALLADLHGTPPSFDPSRLVSAGESLYFTKPNNVDLWGTDGTTAGTRRVFQSHIVHLAPRADGSELLFSEEYSLWSIASAASTPRLVHRFSGPAGRFVSVPGSTYISSGLDFLRLDDGATTTTTLLSLNGWFNLMPPFGFTPTGGVVYFLASQGSFGSSGLWVTNGTAAGTKLVKSGGVGARNTVNEFVAMTEGSGTSGQGKLWFIHRNGATRELWLADFTGARKVATIGSNTAYPGTYPEPIAAFGNGVVFAGQDAAGLEPWFSDGTTTSRLADLNPGAGDSNPQEFAVAGNTLFFAADDGVHGAELWRSNGTAAGTARVADIWPGMMGSDPAGLVAAGSGARVVFSANDGDSGYEAWVSDGTASGTSRIADAVPGAGGAAPTDFVRLGTQFVLSAYAPDRGREPHVLPLVDTGGWLAEPYGAGCLGSAGVPVLAASGAARVGASGFAIEISQARANSGATLFAGLYGRVPLGKCELLLNPVLPLLRVITDAAGRGSYGLAIPNNTSLLGIDVRFQALVSDAAGASGLGLSTTNGLHVMVGR